MINLLAEFVAAAVMRAMNGLPPLPEEQARDWVDAYVWCSRWALAAEQEAAR